ncbi:MAG TPA: very short patch repair endonuclease [Flavobacteriales bacterium]|nr:very short patch repair endonuclease [Flavobacteriales bacterium]
MDRLSKEKRSWNMSLIKGRDTKPEMIVRKMLHRLGYRFRLHRKNLPGTPDIVLPKYNTVIFVHGCFWHRHAGCRYAYKPKSRVNFWQDKIRQNMERDRKVSLQLKELGWQVEIIWECETKNNEKLVQQLTRLFICNAAQ